MKIANTLPKPTALSLGISLAVLSMASMTARANETSTLPASIHQDNANQAKTHGRFVVVQASTKTQQKDTSPQTFTPSALIRTNTPSTEPKQHGQFLITTAHNKTTSNPQDTPITAHPAPADPAFSSLTSSIASAPIPTQTPTVIDGLDDSAGLNNLAGLAVGEFPSVPAANKHQSTYQIHNPKQQLQSQINQQAQNRQSATLGDSDNPNANQSLAALASFYQKNQSPPNHSRHFNSACQGRWLYHSPYPSFRLDGTLNASANYGYYRPSRYAELLGNVVLTQNDSQVLADKVEYDPSQTQGYATGNVRFGSLNPAQSQSHQGFSQSDLMGVADRLAFNTSTGQASAANIAFASQSLHAHGYANRLERPDNQRYTLEQALFSTCPPDMRTWHIQAKNIELNTDTGRGIAKNTTLKIKNVPILYLPYFNFPIDERRVSGFLVPKIGIDSKSGIQLSTPYYLNLAPNYDATLTPTFYTNRNPMLHGEFRYLTAFGAGKLEGAYLPSDKEYHKKDRHHLFFDHNHRPFADKPITLYATYRQVSDSNYLSDFDTLGIENNLLNLPRRIGASYNNAFVTADLRAESYQKLEGSDRLGNAILDKDRPYHRLPQLSARYRLPNERWQGVLGRLDMAGISDLAYFKKSIKDNSDSEKSGLRLYNHLSASYPMIRPWGYITPKLALSQLYTAYDEDSLDSQNLDKKNGDKLVVLPSVSVDMGMYFEKKGAPFALMDGGYQVLAPRLKYHYTPYKDQSDMPNFETSLASMSYEQLLSDSWFLGYDRIGDLHAITPALSYRYIDKTGLTKINAAIAEQLYLNKPKVGLTGQANFNARTSGLAWQASFAPNAHWYFDNFGSLTPDYRLNSFVGAVRYQPYANALFNVGYIKRKENQTIGQLGLSAYTASAIYPINEKWQAVGSVQYDKNFGEFMEVLAGVNYHDCCIGFSIYGRSYRNDLNPNEKNEALMAELRLHGLSGTGRLSKLLRERVPGYTNLSE